MLPTRVTRSTSDAAPADFRQAGRTARGHPLVLTA